LKVLPVPERQETFGVIELDSAGAPADAPTARLVAALLLGAWRVAFREALRRQRSARAASTREVFLDLLDRGFTAASAAARGTPYV
jgi:hypothetical protein